MTSLQNARIKEFEIEVRKRGGAGRKRTDGLEGKQQTRKPWHSFCGCRWSYADGLQ